nr:hypothetical protein Itr_chr09CG04460 [Ipomoea trifida]
MEFPVTCDDRSFEKKEGTKRKRSQKGRREIVGDGGRWRTEGACSDFRVGA